MTATIVSPGTIVIGPWLVLNEVDADGVEWTFYEIDGWTNGPSVKVEQVQRITSHGQFPQPGRRGGRVITIKGKIYADSRALVAAAVDKLASVLADGGFDYFGFYDESVGDRWAMVQLLDTPDTSWNDSDGKLCRFQLQLLSADAYKYGTTSTDSTPFGSDPVGDGLVFNLFPSPSTLDFGAQGTTGTLTIDNLGNAEASVKFTVTGPTPSGGFVIFDTTTGKRISYVGEVVASGSTIVLDGSDGSVLIDGYADRLGDTIVEAWPVLDPESSRDFVFTPLGTATASVLTAECVATYW